jgi:hypothetical protein
VYESQQSMKIRLRNSRVQFASASLSLVSLAIAGYFHRAICNAATNFRSAHSCEHSVRSYDLPSTYRALICFSRRA